MSRRGRTALRHEMFVGVHRSSRPSSSAGDGPPGVGSYRRRGMTEMRVDGFRFDLAPTLARQYGNFDRVSAFLDLVSQDPVVSRAKLIAEPWDVGQVDSYGVGRFPPLWAGVERPIPGHDARLLAQPRRSPRRLRQPPDRERHRRQPLVELRCRLVRGGRGPARVHQATGGAPADRPRVPAAPAPGRSGGRRTAVVHPGRNPLTAAKWRDPRRAQPGAAAARSAERSGVADPVAVGPRSVVVLQGSAGR
jgi:hypothetical protein